MYIQTKTPGHKWRPGHREYKWRPGHSKRNYRLGHRDTNDDQDTGNINDDRDTGTHVFRSIPHDSNDCPWALLMVIANRRFPVSPSLLIYPPVPPGVPVVVVTLCPGRHLYSLCPGRHLCPGVPVCDFSLRVWGVIYIPCVPVVICVPVSRSVYTFVFELVFFLGFSFLPFFFSFFSYTSWF